jgi:hypothetical protein
VFAIDLFFFSDYFVFFRGGFMIFLFSFLMTFFASATDKGVTVDELIQATQLTEEQIISKTEAALEVYLFTDGDGISCGLESFYVSGYVTPKTDMMKTEFTIVTDVVGPIGACQGYESFMCYTRWKNQNGKWAVNDTDCEGNLYDE